MRDVIASYLGRRNLMAIAGIQIPSYTVMLYLGCTSGVFAGAVVAREVGLQPTRFAVAAVLLLIPALIGSRLYYVIQRLSHFRRDPARVWKRGDSGSALYGGLVLSLVLSAPTLAALRLPFWTFWDAATVTMIVGLIITRIGCLLHGCCAGRETTSRVGVWLPNHRGEWRRRVPTQVIEAALGVLLLIGVLVALLQTPIPGALVLSVLTLYATARLLLEPAREQDPHVAVTRLNVMVWSVLLVTSASALLFKTVL